MSEQSDDAGTSAGTGDHRIRMPIEDRVPPDDWSAEHPDEAPEPASPSATRDAERLRSTPWGYR